MNDDRELKSMATIAEAFTGLDEAAVGRVIRWAAERYQVLLSLPKSSFVGATSSQRHAPEVDDLATLFDSASPQTDAEKALVGGYWFQVVKDQKDFEAQPLNTELKNLGHGVGNITDAFASLMGRTPALVMQTQKTGSSRQARKRYRLTTAGIDWISRRLRGEQPDERR
jgi:hypothetical protein